ncbi:unnamed protein product [Microthlaspi erraticum]|uniref:Uncharacterized protein n=1 Tax=Microthlaspi erraticum TaxID=1685480 RepID=A0A6D2IBJ6_9BRAS|nr:unnamed protein product [Microthlaspi erraticum]
MASKALILVGLFAVLLVVSEVAMASGRQSVTVKSESKETLHPDELPPAYGPPNSQLPPAYGQAPPTPPIRGGAYCRYGCCYRSVNSYYCSRCCSYAGEAVQTQPGH